MILSLLVVMTCAQYPVQQGKGQDGGAWNISGTVTVNGGFTGANGVFIDGGVISYGRPCTCASRPDSHKASTITTAVKRLPQDGGFASRSYMVVKVHPRTTGNIICMTNGQTPTFATSEAGAGLSLAVNEFVVVSEPDLTTDGGAGVLCVGDTAGGTIVTTFECACNP